MYKMTASLLNSYMYWRYQVDDEYSESAYESFINTLNKVKFEPNIYMQKGIDFENAVNQLIDTGTYNNTQFNKLELDAIVKVARICDGGISQAYAEKIINTAGYDFKLLGYMDYLKAGVIYDIKRKSKAYEYGSYYHTSQQSVYFELVPEATRFDYLVFDGSKFSIETYRPDTTKKVTELINEFIDFLRNNDLIKIYEEHWRIDDASL